MNDKELEARLSEILRLLDRKKYSETYDAIKQLKDDIARPDRKWAEPPIKWDGSLR